MQNYVLTKFLDSLEDQGIPGCDCAIYYQQKPIYRHMAGYADTEKAKPITAETTYWLYSVTKIFTVTAIMQLVDKGIIELDDPVYAYIPEYLNLKVKEGSELRHAKQIMTIRHLLTMQSGLNYNITSQSIRKVTSDSNRQASTVEVIRALAEEPLDFEPGVRYQYSLSHDVLGAVIEMVSGKPFDQYLSDSIFKPLGMNDTGFDLTPEKEDRMSQQFIYSPKSRTSKQTKKTNSYILTRNYKSGGAGLISTVDDCIRFLDAMCNNGTNPNGYQILSRKAIDLMRSDQLSEGSKLFFDKPGYSYGLGVRTLVDKEGARSKSPIGEFGGGGAAGSYALIDVKNQLAIFYAQHVLGCEYAHQVVHPKIRNLTYELLQLE